MSEPGITVIGGGLAGCEAAWQIAEAGVAVELYEMRPKRPTPAHHTNNLGELVCSNSLGSYDTNSASALLKEELKLLDCKLLKIAFACQVPAGKALAVDRLAFAEAVTDAVHTHPRITLRRDEVLELPKQSVTVVATGPLTSDNLARSIQKVTGKDQLHFFDAAAPILTRDSIDMTRVFAQSRYDAGQGEYLNCPMNKTEYLNFAAALTSAERVEIKDFERDTPYFNACLPVEVIASRGVDTLRFGPMKPVGLCNPATGKRPYAVVQLRQDDGAANLYNIVGFQTNLKWGEQKRVFKLIPGLASAEFVRLGVMHRNTYLNSPEVLAPTLQLKQNPRIFMAGQITGVEGYTESIATGLAAARNALQLLAGDEPRVISRDTMIGSLIGYITSANPHNFQPINSNWGLFEVPQTWLTLNKSDKRKKIAERALATIKSSFTPGRASSPA